MTLTNDERERLEQLKSEMAKAPYPVQFGEVEEMAREFLATIGIKDYRLAQSGSATAWKAAHNVADIRAGSHAWEREVVVLKAGIVHELKGINSGIFSRILSEKARKAWTTADAASFLLVVDGVEMTIDNGQGEDSEGLALSIDRAALYDPAERFIPVESQPDYYGFERVATIKAQKGARVCSHDCDPESAAIELEGPARFTVYRKAGQLLIVKD